jgi:hypothetical protein
MGRFGFSVALKPIGTSVELDEDTLEQLAADIGEAIRAYLESRLTGDVDRKLLRSVDDDGRALDDDVTIDDASRRRIRALPAGRRAQAPTSADTRSTLNTPLMRDSERMTLLS